MSIEELATGIFLFCVVPALAVAAVVNVTLRAVL